MYRGHWLPLIGNYPWNTLVLKYLYSARNYEKYFVVQIILI